MGKYSHHLRQVLQEHYEILEYWKGSKFAVIEMEWNYSPIHNNRTFCLFIKGYIERILTQFGHKRPTKTQLFPHKNSVICYGSKVQEDPKEVTSPSLDATGIKYVQSIVLEVLFYGLAVEKKILVELNAIVTQQATATESTNEAINHLLDYLATYPNDGIIYRSRSMVLAAHSYAGFHNKSKGCSQFGSHIFLAENEPVPRWNGPILTISQVIKTFMYSAAEA